MAGDFFDALPAFTDFVAVADAARFRPAPEDWLVAIADVVGSTRAVDEGRYKDVNLIGASCISAALNVADGVDIPYVFGGDGATLLIPRTMRERVRDALVRTAVLGRSAFDLDLRLGFVPIADIRARGLDVLVGRYELSPGNSLAMFSGGGVELADRLVKDDDGTQGYREPDVVTAEPPDLTGLSCRWEPLRSRNGQVVCLLARALDERGPARVATYHEIITQLTDILGGELGSASPVSRQSMRFRWPPRGLWAEAKLTSGQARTVGRYAYLLGESLVQSVLERFDLKLGAYDAPVYRAELRANSDFRRFDDVLRMVLDCTPEQVSRLEAALERQRAAGRLAYGLHVTDQALMTCMVFSLENGEHLHFVDGDGGGFWAAAEDYKRQLARAGGG